MTMDLLIILLSDYSYSIDDSDSTDSCILFIIDVLQSIDSTFIPSSNSNYQNILQYSTWPTVLIITIDSLVNQDYC